MKIGFIGMGKLGLPCALAIESRGHEVIGCDTNPEVGFYISDKKIPYREEGAEELLQKTKIQIKNQFDVLLESDIVFVTIQTPHDSRYEGTTPLPKERVDFDYSYLISGIKDIITDVLHINLMTKKINVPKKQVVLSIISTVLPGTMYRDIFPLIPEHLDNLHIVYNPFFIAMGTTIKDFLYPEFVLLGVDDPYAAEIVEKFYKDVLLHQYNDPFLDQPRVFKCSINTAEAVKVLYNTYITQKICFANAAMELCEKTGADVDDLMDALALGNRRIVSASYMRAGMGDGGGCHPRDNIALSHIAKELNISYDWWENLMVAREEQTKWLASIIAERVYEIERNGRKIETMILGYTFKPETNLIVGSPALLLKNVLETIWNIKPIMFDPFIDEADIFEEHPDSVSKDSLLHILCEPRIFFIGTKHEVFKNYIFPAGSVVIDPFRYIPEQDGVFIKRIGQSKSKL